MEHKLIMENWRKYLAEDLGSKLLSDDPKRREFAKLISKGWPEPLEGFAGSPQAMVVQSLIRTAPSLARSKQTLAMLAAVVSQRVSDLMSDDPAKTLDMKDAIDSVVKDVVKDKKEDTKCKEGLYRGQGLRATSQTSGAEIRAGSDYEGTRQGGGYKGLYLSIMNSYNTHKSNKEICRNHMGYHFSSRKNKPDPENLFMVSFECCKEEIKEFSFPGISRLNDEEIEQFKQMGFKVLVAYRSTPTPEYAILDNTILTDIEKIGTYDYTLSREENAKILCAKL